MRPTVREEELLRKVVRGERPYTDLETIGISVTVDGEACQIDNPRHLYIDVTLEDMAHGVLALQSTPDGLRRWAWLVLAAPSIFDLDLEGDIRGNLFLEALWELAFDGAPILPVTKLAEDLTRQ